MTVQELIDELTKLPPDLSVKLAFDTGVRMEIGRASCRERVYSSV